MSFISFPRQHRKSTFSSAMRDILFLRLRTAENWLEPAKLTPVAIKFLAHIRIVPFVSVHVGKHPNGGESESHYYVRPPTYGERRVRHSSWFWRWGIKTLEKKRDWKSDVALRESKTNLRCQCHSRAPAFTQKFKLHMVPHQFTESH